jgi:hypothetical protein
VNDIKSPAPAPGEWPGALAGQFPGWEGWRGVSGILYARRRKSSPPVVFRDTTAAGLIRQIRAWEKKRKPG